MENDLRIDFDDVSFFYEDGGASVQNINEKFYAGDFVAIIGSNGAGKSTFSKLCNGLLKPTSGTVSVMGYDTKKTKVSALAKHIGFLFQNPDRQICCGTVEEELKFSLEKQGVQKDVIEKKVNAVLKEFGFDKKAEPFNLSRGQRQRLCLACLIAVEPEILVLDEPTTGLDYKECIHIMERVKKLNQGGTTVLMVCHDMEIVLDYAQKTIVMDNGKILGSGKTRDILGNPSLLKSARLMQPQIAQTATYLGNDFKDVFTVSEMVQKIQTLKGGAQ